jgi:glycosyltransferase involved in cell wall biosynthesis
METQTPPPPAILAVSHLSWDLVFQRPQHLMARAARDRTVLYVEEARYDAQVPAWEQRMTAQGVRVCVPHMAPDMAPERRDAVLAAMIDALVAEHDLDPFVLWFQTPMSVAHTAQLEPVATVYDCMDELSAFAGAPPQLRSNERALLARADLVFTGGMALYEHKRREHPAVHAFPSSVDVAHFARARGPVEEPADQRSIPGPKIGFFGVVDERMDRELLGELARRRPEWSFVVIGPVVKIDPTRLPDAPNIHYLGSRDYEDLPAYLSGWDVAIMPFARNDATRFISPTKTPEYLAGGKPVVSTRIRDVERPWADLGLVRIADTPRGFVDAIEDAMAEDARARVARADAALRTISWDATWDEMDGLIGGVVLGRRRRLVPT